MMTNEPLRPSGDQEAKKGSTLTPILQSIWKTISHQWGWKLLSIVLAVFLWGGLISQDATLPREKVFTNVKVNVVNAALLRQNGFIVTSGLEDINNVIIKAQVPQKYYSTASASNYTVRVDLSQIKAAGEQTLRITAASTNSSLYGSVTDISLSQITVQVEEYTTRTRIPVQGRLSGDAPQGFYADTPTFDPSMVDIGGPRSVVESVARCVVLYDMSGIAPGQGMARTSASFIFEDRLGNQLNDTNLTVSSQSVTLRDIVVNQELYPTIQVPISTANLISGQPAEGYQVTGVTIFPETVTIAASDLSLYQDEKALIFPYSRLSINGETQGVTGKLSLSRASDVMYMSTREVTVMVNIAPISTEDVP